MKNTDQNFQYFSSHHILLNISPLIIYTCMQILECLCLWRFSLGAQLSDLLIERQIFHFHSLFMAPLLFVFPADLRRHTLRMHFMHQKREINNMRGQSGVWVKASGRIKEAATSQVTHATFERFPSGLRIGGWQGEGLLTCSCTVRVEIRFHSTTCFNWPAGNKHLSL